MTIVFESPLWELEELGDYCVLRRTDVRSDDLAALREQNRSVMESFDAKHRGWGLIVDMRRAPARNDPGFEDAMKPLRAEVQRRFARVAVLLSSAVGVLQVERLRTTEHADSLTTRDEAEAVAFARGN